MFIYYSF